jgi:hypothetical protein
VHEQFQFDPDLNPAEIIRAVLRVMYRHMGEGELGDVKFNMLESIQEWFPEDPGHGNKMNILNWIGFSGKYFLIFLPAPEFSLYVPAENLIYSNLSKLSPAVPFSKRLYHINPNYVKTRQCYKSE